MRQDAAGFVGGGRGHKPRNRMQGNTGKDILPQSVQMQHSLADVGAGYLTSDFPSGALRG